MFANRNHSPSGVIARFCGPFPRLDVMAVSDRRPSSTRTSSIPALIIFRDGQVAARHVGVIPKATLRSEMQGLK
jgi:hypothetical protein